MSALPMGELLRALAVEIARSEEFRSVVREELAARQPAGTEMVSTATFAREHSLNVATVRQMAKNGRIEAVRIGKRQWRVRRDSPIGQPMARGATSADTPAERARRLVEKFR
jgi:excisionase family DNA binding protein